ncbi:MAG: hypothetical protein RPR40_04960 [Bermanella sp.]
MLYLCCFMAACSSGGDDEPVLPATLSGFWSGSTTENLGTVQSKIVSFVLFYQDDVYILREDETQLGGYAIEDNGHSSLLLDVHPYNNPDAVNFFFVGTYNNIKLPLEATFIEDLDLVINYNTLTRAGRMELVLDVEQQLELPLSRVAGDWKTTDGVMKVNTDGGFSGWNASTSCQWQGTLSPLTTSLLSMRIERENCLEFNVPFDEIAPANGLALIDGDGILHFIASESPRVLWMRFDPVAATETADDAVAAP